MISSPDTNVFVICLSVDLFTDANLLLLTGVKNSKRTIDATKGADYILKSLNSCEISKEILIKSLVGFHNFAQCDAISAFAGRGKVESLKLMLRGTRYVEAFAQLREQTEISYQG